MKITVLKQELGGDVALLGELGLLRAEDPVEVEPGLPDRHDLWVLCEVDQLLLVAEVLQTRSVALAWTDDNITEPAVLRRADGSSVYTVAGSELFTSARILAAEQRLVAAAGRCKVAVMYSLLCRKRPSRASARASGSPRARGWSAASRGASVRITA